MRWKNSATRPSSSAAAASACRSVSASAVVAASAESIQRARPLFGGKPGGNQRAALQCGLDNQDAADQARDDAVATWKVGGDGGRAEREFGNDGSLFGNCHREFLVARRVDAVSAGADEGNRGTFGGEGATMGGGVDAQREAADNGQPGIAQRLREGLGVALALGGALGTIAVIVRQEIVLAIMGGIFVVETLSVMLQVSWFKFTKKKYGTGRRILKMAPLHHHFEKSGWKETQVVVRFWIITMLLCLVGLSALKLR